MNDEYDAIVRKYWTFYIGDRMERVRDLISMLEDDWTGGIWFQNNLLVLTTKGLSRNEWIVKGLGMNSIFWELFWNDSSVGGIHRFRIPREEIPASILKRLPEPRYPGLIRTISGTEIKIKPECRIVTKCNTCPMAGQCDRSNDHTCSVNIEIFPEGAIILRRDGDMWMAHDMLFIDLQISHYAFGASPEEALKGYLSEKPEAE